MRGVIDKLPFLDNFFAVCFACH